MEPYTVAKVTLVNVALQREYRKCFFKFLTHVQVGFLYMYSKHLANDPMLLVSYNSAREVLIGSSPE